MEVIVRIKMEDMKMYNQRYISGGCGVKLTWTGSMKPYTGL